jgi:hypothetical protein
MINILRKSALGLGVAGTLAVAAATPSLARVVAAHPGNGYGYGYGQQTYAGPYGGYAYAPGYGSRSWNSPAADDIDGPYSSCFPSLRWQNRC